MIYLFFHPTSDVHVLGWSSKSRPKGFQAIDFTLFMLGLIHEHLGTTRFDSHQYEVAVEQCNIHEVYITIF